MKIRELMAKRAELLQAAEGLYTAAEAENRAMSETEQETFDQNMTEADGLTKRIEQRQELERRAAEVQIARPAAPAVLKIGRGDTEARAWAHFVRTGDAGGLAELRASNDTTMNITTDADGAYAVPTGHFQGIIARRDESSLVQKLGVREIPGKGTTVNIPVDNEDDGEFVSTAESGAYDRDAPALDQKQSTLVKYSKKVDLTVELLEDEDSRIMAFLEDFVGRGYAKTLNSLLLTEVAANGTEWKEFASATAIAVDELEPIVYYEGLENYLDDAGSAAWVMRRSVHGEIILLDDANVRRYANNRMGNEGGPDLLGFPIHYSAKSGATAASTASVYFGNWNYVGVRFGPGMTVLRDPYTRGGYGEVLLYYMFRCDFNVLQAEAIGYGAHPSA